MSSQSPQAKPRVDWLTVAAIAAIAISLTVAAHEGIHALTCLGVGGDLQAYSALAVACEERTVRQEKWVNGSAPFFNLLAGTLLWLILRRDRQVSPDTWFFLWLLMLMNLLYGAGYFMFSGIAGVGDIAVVIASWEPAWLWRVLATLFGSALFLFCVWWALQVFGRRVGGRPKEQIRRANKMSLISYFSALGVILLAGLFNPLGMLSLPVMAGLLAVLGGLSPLLWMMHWFQAGIFPKQEGPPLEIHRRWGWVAVSLAVVLLYAVFLGRAVYF